jgi:hypothetical protein
MSAPVAPGGGVFRRAGFQARNVLPVFAIHTCRTIHACRTDDVMRTETLTIDVNYYPTIEQSTISGSREAGNRRERQTDGVPAFLALRFQLFGAGLDPLPRSPNGATHPPSAPSPEELPRTRTWKRPAVSLPSVYPRQLSISLVWHILQEERRCLLVIASRYNRLNAFAEA